MVCWWTRLQNPWCHDLANGAANKFTQPGHHLQFIQNEFAVKSAIHCKLEQKGLAFLQGNNLLARGAPAAVAGKPEAGPRPLCSSRQQHGREALQPYVWLSPSRRLPKSLVKKGRHLPVKLRGTGTLHKTAVTSRDAAQENRSQLPHAARRAGAEQVF